MTVWDPNKEIVIERLSICGGGCLERFYDIHTYMQMYIYSKASLNRPTMGPTISGLFREVVGLGS